MRRLLIACALLLWSGMLLAQDSSFIRYYPAPVAGTSGGGATFTGQVKMADGTSAAPSLAWGTGNQGFKFDTGNFSFIFAVGGTDYTIQNTAGFGNRSAGWFFWYPSTILGAAPDLVLKRAAANTLLQENADAPQFSRVSAGFSGYGEIGTATEEVTLATGAVTTDSTANLLPAGAIIEAVTYRVTTTITTAVNFSIGDATTAARFVSGATGVAAGSTGTGLLHNNPTVADAAGPVQSAAAKIRITTNANPGAGKIRVQVFYRFFGVPST
jgi:hypothetical protein